MSDNASQPTAASEIAAPEELSSEESLEEASPAQEAAAQKKKIKQLKLKFNGKESVEELPFEIDEDQQDWYVKQLQKAKLADHKANEYAQLEREVGAFIQELRKNPKKALSNPAVGLDIKELAASILQDEIERSQKSPEQLRAEEAELKLQELLEEREREKLEYEEKQMQIMTDRAIEKYDSDMSAAIEQSGLPKSPYITKRMIELMYMAVENDIDLSAGQAMQVVKDEMYQDLRDMLGPMPSEMIEQILGAEFGQKFKPKKKAAAPQAPVPVNKAIKDVAKDKTVEKKEDKKQTYRDFFGV